MDNSLQGIHPQLAAIPSEAPQAGLEQLAVTSEAEMAGALLEAVQHQHQQQQQQQQQQFGHDGHPLLAQDGPEVAAARANLEAALRSADAHDLPLHLLHASAYLDNQKRNGTEVTRLFIDAVTKASPRSGRDTFLPSHKASPSHIHTLAAKCLPAEVLQGPKSYNDALAKKYGRKKGDMGSSSAGIKDRGIFPGVEYCNPDSPKDLADLTVKLAPLTAIFAANNLSVDGVVAEVRAVRAGWREADYRVWLKNYQPDPNKRPRLSHAGGGGDSDDGGPRGEDGATPDLHQHLLNGGLISFTPQQQPLLLAAGQQDAANLTSQVQDAIRMGQMSEAREDGAGNSAEGMVGQGAQARQQQQQRYSAVGTGTVGQPWKQLLKSFVQSCFQKNIVTGTQMKEMMDFVNECCGPTEPPQADVAQQHHKQEHM